MSRAHLLARYVAGIAGAGLAAASRRRRHRRGDYRVFILEYHDVALAPPEGEGVVSAARLRRHLAYLARHYRCVRLSEAVERLGRRDGLGEDLVVITFDDGYAGNYEAAWDVLRAAHMPATIFVATGFLDGEELWFDRGRRLLSAAQRATPLPAALHAQLRDVFGAWPAAALHNGGFDRLKYAAPEVRRSLLAALAAACPATGIAARPLRWTEVREMRAAGVEIGCHTVTHPILSLLSPSQQSEEIERARDRIGSETGTTPTLFAYPNGDRRDFTQDTLDRVRAAGFRAACTTIRGSNAAGADPFTLRRLGVGADPLFVLAARLGGAFDESLRQRLAGVSRRLHAASLRLPGHFPTDHSAGSRR